MSGENEPRQEWRTPPREEHAVRGWQVAVVLAGAFLIFTIAVLFTWMQLQNRQSSLGPERTVIPAELGQADINIVNTSLIQLDTRAYELQERQRQRLHSYGWVDRDGGVVHIPIGEAMERLVRERQRPAGEGGP